MVVPLRIKFQQCRFLKKHLLNACKIKEFWPLCLQPAELLYFAGIFILNGKQLLNKTDTFSSKIFVYSQNDNSFFKCLNEYGGTFTEIFMIMMQGWHKLKNS